MDWLLQLIPFYVLICKEYKHEPLAFAWVVWQGCHKLRHVSGCIIAIFSGADLPYVLPQHRSLNQVFANGDDKASVDNLSASSVLGLYEMSLYEAYILGNGGRHYNSPHGNLKLQLINCSVEVDVHCANAIHQSGLVSACCPSIQIMITTDFHS